MDYLILFFYDTLNYYHYAYNFMDYKMRMWRY